MVTLHTEFFVTYRKILNFALLLQLPQVINNKYAAIVYIDRPVGFDVGQTISKAGPEWVVYFAIWEDIFDALKAANFEFFWLSSDYFFMEGRK